MDQTLVISGDELPAAVAHVLNLTGTQSAAPGRLIAWSGEAERPTTSAVNFHHGEDAPKIATMPAASNRQIAVTSRSSSAHVIVDHHGIFY